MRFLLSVLRVTPELERSHDLVMQVADRAGLAAPGGDLTPRARDLAARMGDLTGEMWRQAADAWYQRDRSAAEAMAGRARELDWLHAALAAELAASQVTTPAAMEMTLVARCYQRLAHTPSTLPGGPVTSPGPQEDNRCRTAPAGSGAPPDVNGNMASHAPVLRARHGSSREAGFLQAPRGSGIVTELGPLRYPGAGSMPVSRKRTAGQPPTPQPSAVLRAEADG